MSRSPNPCLVKADINAYLAKRGDPEMHRLEDLIHFNDELSAEEMPYFEQEIFHMAQEKGALTDQIYVDPLLARQALVLGQGIDAVMDQHRLDVRVTPTAEPPWAIDLVDGDHFLGTTRSTPGRPIGISY